MSLKQTSEEIFTTYGLGPDEIKVYLGYLGLPQATASEISTMLDMALPAVEAATKKLEGINFLKRIKAAEVDRFVPLEPYLELFVKTSEVFRSEIDEIKNKVLTDQHTRYESLEGIQNKAVGEIDQAVDNQVEEFFKVSDEHDVSMKNNLHTIRTRFESTGKGLEGNIQAVTFKARDRFIETGKALEADLQGILFQGRDRNNATMKKLESEVHQTVDEAYSQFKSDLNARYEETAGLITTHAKKFTEENNGLNAALDQITSDHNAATKQLEQNLHKTLDALNEKLKGISNEFVANYDSGIGTAKNTINSIIGNLLQDFQERLKKLDTQCKKELDEYVEYHRENSMQLKPELLKILDKYVERMDKMLEDLKKRISTLLMEHTDHVNSTTTTLQKQLCERVQARENQLITQVKAFEDQTLILVQNITSIADQMDSLGDDLSSRGVAWKFLFKGRRQFWSELYQNIQERVSKISTKIKADFTASTSEYITDTEGTIKTLQDEITKITKSENGQLKSETEQLDQSQKEQISHELRSVANELASEVEETLKRNVQKAKETTVRLEDSIENSLKSHQEEFVTAIKRHQQTTLEHYDSAQRDVHQKIERWYSDVDMEFSKSKNEASVLTSGQIQVANDHLSKSKTQNTTHARDFTSETETLKAQTRKIFDDLLGKVRADYDGAKKTVSTSVEEEIKTLGAEVAEMDQLEHSKINAEIDLFKGEVAELDANQHKLIDEQIALVHSEAQNLENALHAMLEDHKAKYQENANILRQSLTKTVQDCIASVKEAIADFSLQFINTIEDATERAENDEERLADIQNAAKNLINVPEHTTWNVVGKEQIIACIIDISRRTKSNLTIVTPDVYPEVVKELTELAFTKNQVRIKYTTQWPGQEYETVINQLKQQFGNIQLRQTKGQADYWAAIRDSEEVLLCPNASNQQDLVAVVSSQMSYASLFGEFIGNIFMNNSTRL